jgi:hypothetical protein
MNEPKLSQASEPRQLWPLPTSTTKIGFWQEKMDTLQQSSCRWHEGKHDLIRLIVLDLGFGELSGP